MKNQNPLEGYSVKSQVVWRLYKGSKLDNGIYATIQDAEYAAHKDANQVTIQREWGHFNGDVDIAVKSGPHKVSETIYACDLVRSPRKAHDQVYSVVRAILKELLDMDLHESAREQIKEYLANEEVFKRKLNNLQ